MAATLDNQSSFDKFAKSGEEYSTVTLAVLLDIFLKTARRCKNKKKKKLQMQNICFLDTTKSQMHEDKQKEGTVSPNFTFWVKHNLQV